MSAITQGTARVGFGAITQGGVGFGERAPNMGTERPSFGKRKSVSRPFRKRKNAMMKSRMPLNRTAAATYFPFCREHPADSPRFVARCASLLKLKTPAAFRKKWSRQVSTLA
eukprot:6923026-Prymnesium_polylepis.1